MVDNGDKIQEPEQKNKIIFIAKLNENNEVEIDVYSKYVPMVAYASRLLSIEIDKMIITQRIEKAQEGNKIIKGTHNILNFMRNRGH